jgi:hypothetical protein
MAVFSRTHFKSDQHKKILMRHKDFLPAELGPAPVRTACLFPVSREASSVR